MGRALRRVPSAPRSQTSEGVRTVTVAGTYHEVAKVYLGPQMVLESPIKGFLDGALLICFLLMIGGSFAIFQETGAVEFGIRRLTDAISRRPYLEGLLIPVLMVVFSLAGSIFGMAEETIPFVIIFIPLARRLGYDSIVGASIPFLGAAAGFAAAFFNPFTVGIAQSIAGRAALLGARLPPGHLGRRHGRDDRLRDVVRAAGEAQPGDQPGGATSTASARRSSRTTAGTPSVGHPARRHADALRRVDGAARRRRAEVEVVHRPDRGALLRDGHRARLRRRPRARAAWRARSSTGAKDMVGVVFIVACARALLVIAQDAKILDTILYGASSSLSLLPRGVIAQVMFLIQCVINFFIHSGTAQAALTMPIMAPLADLVGITRQTAVYAYQLCEFINPILPTSAVTMGVLGAAKIPWERWARWFLPLMLILVVAELPAAHPARAVLPMGIALGLRLAAGGSRMALVHG